MADRGRPGTRTNGHGDLDVVAIGNALVDVLSHATEQFVHAQGAPKGTMRLVDEARAHALYESMGPAIEISGGSAANTIVGVASFGGRAHYVGKVRDDQLGAVFAHDLRSTGVGYTTPPATGGPSTGRCLILITPDAQRTMHTYLGASVHLGRGDLDEGVIARGKIPVPRGLSLRPARRPRRPSGSPPASRTRPDARCR